MVTRQIVPIEIREQQLLEMANLAISSRPEPLRQKHLKALFLSVEKNSDLAVIALRHPDVLTIRNGQGTPLAIKAVRHHIEAAETMLRTADINTLEITDLKGLTVRDHITDRYQITLLRKQ